MAGYESVFRLSQYMGDFQPDAQVNGLLGCSFMAFICNSFSAILFSIVFILSDVKFLKITVIPTSVWLYKITQTIL